MIALDRSQLDFCQSEQENIRLLAPAGCGKTISLLYRCRELLERSQEPQRFLMVTFTRSATAELNERIRSDQQFQILRDQVTVSTLNAYGDRRIRDRVRGHRLLASPTDRHFAVMGNLRPTWLEFPHVESAIESHRLNPRRVMDVMDNLKSMGFDHTIDTNFDLFQKRLDELSSQGLDWRIDQQFEILTDIGVLDVPSSGRHEASSRNRRAFYDRFFVFWRKATEQLLGQSRFTFEDQKYWSYIELKSPDAEGNVRPHITGAARYNHLLVDEFQDINPLDLSLIDVIAERNRATMTIVGDDDQAIFEWRGASPEFILNPSNHLHREFKDYQLEVNYRSPKQIVTHSQQLIRHNKNRVSKNIRAVPNAEDATIVLRPTSGIRDRLHIVTDIVRDTEPGRVAVLGRLRKQLIPFQIYFASDGAPFKTASDLDIYASTAFDNLIKLLDIYDSADSRQRPAQAINDAISVCDLIKLHPNRRVNSNFERLMSRARPRTTIQAVNQLTEYNGPKIRGKDHLQLHASASAFLTAKTVSDAIEVIDDEFSGLRFDQERAEEDVWYTDPPLKQLTEIARDEDMSAIDLIDRIERAKDELSAYRSFENDEAGDVDDVLERPLHLITAHRAKGKEFETVVILDVDDKTWPTRAENERELEAERRLFYVAFTRARKKVIMLHEKGAQLSPFVAELGVD